MSTYEQQNTEVTTATLPEFPAYTFYADGRIYSDYLNRFLIQNAINGRGYKVVNLRDKIGKSKTYNLHSIIARAFLGESTGLYVDHINRVRTDNRIENLRYVTASENTRNSIQQDNSASKYVGVTWCKKQGKWKSRITINNKDVNIAYHVDEIEAAKAYDRYAVTVGRKPNFSTATITAIPTFTKPKFI
ncbi:HNH endonuclease [Hymenobacter sublimis]|uniref:HNH endonuclease n=1 Tax=Hymenobacter sublimis TaxID=2933777 RepID=A0ABY4JCK3_9BACT|nr:HNH endonuclease [Hymenobacter sublimis]UPL50543.1 HNH endonuclease [Hymenobacter sublimis]